MGVAFLANIYGCFTLSKFFTGSAVYSILSSQALFACMQIIIEALYLQYEAYKNNSWFASYFDFYKIKETLAKTLNTIAILAWCVLLANNLNIYDSIYDSVTEFLTAQRQVGNTTFSFQSIFIFIIVIWISTAISKFITALSTGIGDKTKSQKSKWGSSLLLLKIGVLSLGILFAFA